MPDELDDTIRESAVGPAEAEADGVSVAGQKPEAQIAADRYLADKAARALHPGKSFTRVQIVPPGA